MLPAIIFPKRHMWEPEEVWAGISRQTIITLVSWNLPSNILIKCKQEKKDICPFVPR